MNVTLKPEDEIKIIDFNDIENSLFVLAKNIKDLNYIITKNRITILKEDLSLENFKNLLEQNDSVITNLFKLENSRVYFDFGFNCIHVNSDLFFSFLYEKKLNL